MTFLNPFVLFGLAAAAIPILIHLFNIRKLNTIEFSTLRFLKELQKNKMRKIKVRQWLLLALRTILILLIVLAFSRPALKGSFGSLSSHAKSTIVILFDNSASMELSNERGKFLTQAQTQALKIISLLQENDDVFFLRLSDLPVATTEEPTHNIQKIESLIRQTEISFSHRTIKDGLRLASRLLAQSKNFNKEVYIITDGQVSTLSEEKKKENLKESLFEPHVKIFYSSLSQKEIANIAIEQITVPPSLFQTGKLFILNVEIKNYGTTSVENHLVAVTVGNNRVMQKSISLGGGERGTLEFSITPSHSGFMTGFVELEDDLFESDNRSYFSINIPEQIQLAIISKEEKYSRYISTALSVSGIFKNSSPIIINKLLPTQITTTALSHNDIVILSGINDLSGNQISTVQQYVSNGGNVIFFPAAETTVILYNYMKPLGIAEMQLSRSSTTFEKVDYQFPIFQGMFEQGLKRNRFSIETPQINIGIHARVESNLRSIISLSNGKNFLWQRELGRGRILGFSVPAIPEWSDFPLKGIFVPLLYQSVLYLSSPINANEQLNYSVGEKIEFNSFQLKKGRLLSPSSLQLFDAEKRSTPLTAYNKATSGGISHSIFSFDNPMKAGIYTVLSQRDTVLTLPINTRREESDGMLAKKEQTIAILRELGIAEESITQLEPDSEITETVLQSRFGIELWRYFLIAALVIALIEMLVAREPKPKI
ncbi:MAG: BatA domain-containing protein [Bacteroidota bacterium]|nr:BatA domain-containing protein [Bacteroidota bacterium]